MSWDGYLAETSHISNNSISTIIWYLKKLSFYDFLSLTIIILLLVFTPVWLEWDIAYFCLLVSLTLGAIMFLLFIYNSSNKLFFYNGDMLSVFSGYYLFLLEKTTYHSLFNDTFISINVLIGLTMLITGVVNSKKTTSIIDKFIFIINNKQLLFIFALASLFVIFSVNMFLFLVNLGIVVNTSTPTLFIYTFFAIIISSKLVSIFIFFFHLYWAI